MWVWPVPIEVQGAEREAAHVGLGLAFELQDFAALVELVEVPAAERGT
jgi:hypothetical protein